MWVSEFKRGRTSCKDEQRSGRPVEVTTQSKVDQVRTLVLRDRRLKVRELAGEVGISTERVHHILHDCLGMTKLCARWVPRLLTADHKQQRALISAECLNIFLRNPSEFLRRFVTVDETWVHYYTPETKEQSKQWTFRGEPAPRKAKVVPSAGKVMATVFWDSRGVIFIDYLEKGRTITGEYYKCLLDRLAHEIGQKRPHLSRKKVLFHHDNAPVHTARVVTEKVKELRFEMVPHPPYSPDLAPSDFHLFPNLKKWLGGQRFFCDSEVRDAVNGYFEGLEGDF